MELLELQKDVGIKQVTGAAAQQHNLEACCKKQNILKPVNGLRDYFPFLEQQLLANLCTQN